MMERSFSSSGVLWTVTVLTLLASTNAASSNANVSLDLRNLLTDYDFERPIGDEIEFRVLVTGNPSPNIVWFYNHGFLRKQVPLTKKGREGGNQLTTLRIKNITADDIGEYTLRATSGHLQKDITFRLLVRGKPKLNFLINGMDISLEVTSYPASVTKCFTKKCNETSCKNEDEFDDYYMNFARISKTKELLHIKAYQFDKNSTVRCVATNAAGVGESQLTATLERRLELGENMRIAYSETIQADAHFVSLECGAYDLSYMDNVTWLKDGKVLDSSDDIFVEHKKVEYFYTSILHWDARAFDPSGELKCQAKLVKEGVIQEMVWTTQNISSIPKLTVTTDDHQRGNLSSNTSTELKTNAKHLESITCKPHLFTCETVDRYKFKKYVCDERLDCPIVSIGRSCPLDEDIEAPLISPNQRDITLLPGDNYTFTCTSTEPITWTYDGYIERACGRDRWGHERKCNFDPTIRYSSDANGIFQSSFELSRIEYTYVGYYYCMKNSSKEYEMSVLLQTKQASRIYLFVEDPENKVVAADWISINSDPNFVIPCKLTSKNISMPIRLKEKSNKAEIYAYDEYSGFTPINKQLASRYFYQCSIWDGYSYKDKRRHVSDSAGTTFSPPEITTRNDYPGIVGNDLQLDCTIQTKLKEIPSLNITWITPNANMAQTENRTTIETIWGSKEVMYEPTHTITKRLTLKRFDQWKDSGRYQCILGLGADHIMSTYFRIKRPNNGKHFIKMNEEDTSVSYLENSKAMSREWTMSFSGKPAPNVGWLGVDDRKIPWSENDNDWRKKIVATRGANWTKLKIRDLAFTDFGYYRFFADNMQQRKEKIFQLIVKGQPEIKMRTNVHVKPGQNVTIDAEIISYPRAYSTRCFFTPGIEEGTSFLGGQFSLPTRWIYHSEIEQSTQIKLSPARNGTIQCVAQNDYGKDRTEVMASIVVSNRDPNAGEKPSFFSSVRRFFSNLF